MKPNVHYIRRKGDKLVMYLDDWLAREGTVKITAAGVKVDVLDPDRPWELDAKLTEGTAGATAPANRPNIDADWLGLCIGTACGLVGRALEYHEDGGDNLILAIMSDLQTARVWLRRGALGRYANVKHIQREVYGRTA